MWHSKCKQERNARSVKANTDSTEERRSQYVPSLKKFVGLHLAGYEKGVFFSRSNSHGNGTVVKQIRSKANETGFRNLDKPQIAVEYNRFMGGVDKLDQRMGYYSYPHKNVKWYHVIFHHIIEIANVNGFV